MNIVKKKIVYGNHTINNDNFHIVFGIDNDFIRPLGVLMTSIIENNRNENIIFHIISKRIEKINEQIIQQFAINNNIIINIYIIDENIFKDLPKTEYISHATYNRFLIPNILKDITNKVLYLDSDIVCLNNIRLLKNFNIDNNIVGIVEEANKYVEKQQIKELGLTSNKYFNAGVMYINIKEWIKYNTNDKILHLLKNKRKYMFNDQDILNIVLENKCIYMDKIYNYEFDVRYKSNRYVYNIPSNIVFLHYVGKFKPWQEWCMHPLREKFREIARQSLWKDIPWDKPKTYKQMKNMAKSYSIYHQRLKSFYWYIKYAIYKIKINCRGNNL